MGQILKIPNGSNKTPVTSAEKPSTYTVKSGDTLWKISTNHGLSVAQLKTYNHLTSDMLNVGQVFRLTTRSRILLTQKVQTLILMVTH